MSVLPIQKLSPVAAPKDGPEVGPRAGATTQSISALGRALARLQDLHATNPSSFRGAAGQIAEQLHGQARQLPPLRAHFFEQLAGTFERAAASGEFSVLQPLDPNPTPIGVAAQHYAATQAGAARPAPESLAGVIAGAVEAQDRR